MQAKADNFSEQKVFMTPEPNYSKQHPNNTRAFEDRVAIIVGAGRGIGEAVALRFAREGARVVLAARTTVELDSVAAQIRLAGGTALVHATDVADREQVQHLVQVALMRFNGLMWS